MSEPTKRTFPTEVILSITTGRLLCEFSAMHECVEFLTGGPVWTHQFAHESFVDEIAEGVLKQCPQFRNVDPDGITTENYKIKVQDFRNQFGPGVVLSPIGETNSQSASFTEPLRGKPTLFIRTK